LLNLEVEIIADERDFYALEDAWNPLLVRSGSDTIFLTFEWLSTWWKHFGRRHRLFVVVARKEKEIVALLPLMITGREGFRQLCFISNKITDYKDFIIDELQDREQVIRRILGSLVDAGGWDFFLINGFSEESVNFSAFDAALSDFPEARTVFLNDKVAPYIPIEGAWEDYWKSLKKSFRKRTDGQQKHISKDYDDYFCTCIESRHEIDGLIDKVISMNVERWAEEKNQGSVVDDTALREFYKDLSKRVFHLGWLDLSYSMINKDVVSACMGFQYSKKYYGVITSYDHRFSKYSPGRLLMVHKLKESFENELLEFDMLVGNETYKYDFNPTVRKICTVGFFRAGMKARLAYRWFFGIRPKLERLEDSPLRKLYWWYRRNSIRKG